MTAHDEETAGRHFDDALVRAGELLELGNPVPDVMDILDDEWLGSTIWPSASSTLWRAVEALAAHVDRSAMTS